MTKRQVIIVSENPIMRDRLIKKVTDADAEVVLSESNFGVAASELKSRIRRNGESGVDELLYYSGAKGGIVEDHINRIRGINPGITVIKVREGEDYSMSARSRR